MKAATASAFVDSPVKDRSFSMIFIDGLHTSKAVKVDFECSYHRLESGA